MECHISDSNVTVVEEFQKCPHSIKLAYFDTNKVQHAINENVVKIERLTNNILAVKAALSVPKARRESQPLLDPDPNIGGDAGAVGGHSS